MIPARRIRVKICGITRPEDAIAAADAGADAIGLVFYPPSPRAVTPAQARGILAVLPPFVTTVGLFVDAAVAAIDEVIDSVPLDVLQFHGNESAADCGRYARPYIKAVRMQAGVDLHAVAATYADSQALLVDTYVKGVAGGTGEVFDWQRLPADLAKPLILAGGLEPGNVAAACRQVSPWGVDVSGGVEAGKGIKDGQKIRSFIEGVNHV